MIGVTIAMPRFAAVLFASLGVALALSCLPGCTNMAPQYAAQQYAPSYYEGGYNTLTPQQKFQLEDHLSNQSNEAWRTTAQVMSGAGHLLGGTGTLLGAIRASPLTRQSTQSFSNTGSRNHPCPRKCETHGGFHI